MKKQINKHTQALFQYKFYAPEEIQKKYCNGLHREIELKHDAKDEYGELKRNSKGIISITRTKVKNKQWFWLRNNKHDCSFMGFLFRENRVFVYNIQMYDKYNDYKEEYLEITGIFNRLLRKFNIYHLCIILSKALKNIYKESETSESIIIYKKYDKPYHKHRLRYNTIKHNSRERKFIIGKRHTSRIIWNKIILSAIHKTSEYYVFGKLRTERPNSFYFTYLPHTEKQEQCILEDVRKQSERVPRHYTRKGERKKRRRFDSFNPFTE